MDWSGIRAFAFGIDHGVMGSGRPMVLYSPKQHRIFVVGQSDQDVVLASDILLDQIAGPATPTGRQPVIPGKIGAAMG